jgi:CBS domain-containing protein
LNVRDGEGRRGADIMRRGGVSVGPEDPVVVAAELMVETRLRSLPVVQRTSGSPVLVGMVSQDDLLRALRFELVEHTGSSSEGER